MIKVNVVPWSSPVLQQRRGLEDALQPLQGPTCRFTSLSMRNLSQLQPVPGDAKGMGPGSANSPGSGTFPDGGQNLGWPSSAGGASLVPRENTGHLVVAFQLGTCTRQHQPLRKILPISSLSCLFLTNKAGQSKALALNLPFLPCSSAKAIFAKQASFYFCALLSLLNTGY